MMTLLTSAQVRAQKAPDAPSTVHLWRISLAPDSLLPEGWETVLPPAEHARASRFRFARDRVRWVQTRSIVRVLLGHYTQCLPREVPLVYGPYGKPALAPGFCPVPLHINWSHTESLALLALTEGGEVGVDVEQVRTDFDPLAVARGVFASDEWACLQDSIPARRRALFYAFWTAREAALKAQGTGFTFLPTPLSVAALARQDKVRAQGMTLRVLPLAAGMAAAVASFAKDPQICEHDWHDPCTLAMLSPPGSTQRPGDRTPNLLVC